MIATRITTSEISLPLLEIGAEDGADVGALVTTPEETTDTLVAVTLPADDRSLMKALLAKYESKVNTAKEAAVVL